MISVILPCYNEEYSIDEGIKNIKTELDKFGAEYEVIVVDDGSNDESVKKLKSLDVKLVAQTRTALFMRYYDAKSEVISVEDGDEIELKSGRKLTFYTTPYVHFAGAMVTYDSKTKTVFSSDIFGAFSIDWSLYANEYYVEAFKAFTEPYIGSKDALQYAVNKLKTLEIERICPQHGSVIDTDIGKYVQAAEDMEVGVWIL